MKINGVTVYKHTSPSGKVYIGITSQKPEARWQGGRGYQHNEHFFRAILKYGWDNFAHEILAEELTREAACEIEVALIAHYKSNDPAYGYNITAGGDHAEHTLATRLKLRESHLGEKAYFYGQRLSEEHRRKIGDAHRGEKNHFYGKHLSEEHRQRISEANMGEKNGNYGKKHSAESRQKMSANRKGKGTRPRSEETRRRMSEHHAGGADRKAVICVETRIIYASVNDAARAVGIAKSPISKCCRGVPHYNTAGGFHWRWAETNEE